MLFCSVMDSDPDPAFYLDVDPDPGSHNSADTGESGSGSWSDF